MVKSACDRGLLLPVVAPARAILGRRDRTKAAEREVSVVALAKADVDFAPVLLEEVREGVVVEQIFRLDRLNFDRNRLRTMTGHGAMTPPARVPNALHLAGEPQLVHDLAETFDAGVWKKRPKVLWAVDAIRLHAFEDESSVLAQPTSPYDMDCRGVVSVGIFHCRVSVTL